MEFENTEVWGFEHSLRGMRNPKNSWNRSDSHYGCDEIMSCNTCRTGQEESCFNLRNKYIIGENDMKLAQILIKSGNEHRKFMRQIFVSVDITAPLYWWKEFDTYKVGTVANSTSTMHKLTSQPITLDCFEIDDYKKDLKCLEIYDTDIEVDYSTVDFEVHKFINFLENLRQKYLETKDKRYWKELVRWLPESWLQKRTITMNYENVRNIYFQRKNHKLTEWSKSFIKWVESLPYAEELIMYDGKSENP